MPISKVTTGSITDSVAIDTDTLVVDGTNNRVGIGTSSPSAPLHLNGGSDNVVLKATNSTNTGGLFVGARNGTFGSIFSAGDGYIYQGGGQNLSMTADGGGVVRFGTGSTERMRIDSSGNLQLGKTASGIGTNGITLYGDGAIGAADFTRDGGRTLALNRKTSDGEIVEFRKDGTTVGSIGTNGTRFYLAGSGRGLAVDESAYSVLPVNTTGANNDGGVGLGSASARFSNLYLSGGVYLGGTGSANHLDDYEEGTWTPAVTMDSGTSTVSAYGKYVKTGQTVYATFYIQFTAAASTPVVSAITGFPFAHENSGTWAGVGSVRENAQTGYQWHARMNNNSAEALLRRYDNSGAVAVNYIFIGSVTYTTP